MSTQLVNFDADKVLREFISGRRTEEIAKDLNLSISALRYKLASEYPEQWKQSQILKQIKRYEDSQDEIDAAAGDIHEADDHFKLHKATAKQKAAVEKLKSAQWALEKVLVSIYGEHKEAQTHAIQVNINLGRNNAEAIKIDAETINPG